METQTSENDVPARTDAPGDVATIDQALASLGAQKENIIATMRALQRRRDKAVAEESARQKVAAMTDVERAALTQAIQAHSSSQAGAAA